MRFSPGISTPIIRAIRLTLPLFVPRVRADHTNHAFALNNLAVLAKLLDRRSYFHIKLVSKRCRPSNNRTASSPMSQHGPPAKAQPLNLFLPGAPAPYGRLEVAPGKACPAVLPQLCLQLQWHPGGTCHDLRFTFGDQDRMLKMSG